MKIKRLLIIPAKGNSTRIPNKNKKSFFGKPIIYYSILAARMSKLFDHIHVSTNSKKIFYLAKKYGVTPFFYRDKKLCENNTGIFDVLKTDTLKILKLGFNFDEIWCLLPCAPLINFHDLRDLSRKIQLKKIALPCISISRYEAPIEWAYKLKKNNKIAPVFKNKHLIPSQKLNKSYFDAGVLSVFKQKDLLKNNNKKINLKLFGYELPWNKVVDIDEVKDWEKAKILFKIRNIKFK